MRADAWFSWRKEKRAERKHIQDRLYYYLLDVIEIIVKEFDDALLEGKLEDKLLELSKVAGEYDRSLGDHVALLYSYVRALRVRVKSLRSRRGLSVARERLVRDLTTILYQITEERHM